MPPPEPSKNAPRSTSIIQKIQEIITQIGVYFRLDALSLSQLPLPPSKIYVPILQPFEDITFHGPTIGPPNTIDTTSIDIWSLPVQTCSMDIHWIFRGQPTSNNDMIWTDTITMKFFTNSGPNKEIVEIPLSTPAKTECTGDNADRCSAAPSGLRTITASPQHYYRHSDDEYAFNRDYIHFYYGLPGENEFIAFHTDTNGHAEDNYLIPSRFPRCTVARQDPSNAYTRQWVNTQETVRGIPGWTLPYLKRHRQFKVQGDDKTYYDGDAMMFTCFFPCPRIG
ncbi:uncharacterized protein DFL_005321 [Arthrobotrys flagrans]|uniref:Uncharacterized protein n=1 Tax=Arthrobotrys flagrans TaxID=97331 RepID=A0A437A7A5_ARTFL|nr:hypothetical protein DFL_005321 [Arthrobotrys flagrans]